MQCQPHRSESDPSPACCFWPEQEERIRRGDDLRLQMAIEESKRETVGQEEVSVGAGPGLGGWAGGLAG